MADTKSNTTTTVATATTIALLVGGAQYSLSTPCHCRQKPAAVATVDPALASARRIIVKTTDEAAARNFCRANYLEFGLVKWQDGQATILLRKPPLTPEQLAAVRTLGEVGPETALPAEHKGH